VSGRRSGLRKYSGARLVSKNHAGGEGKKQTMKEKGPQGGGSKRGIGGKQRHKKRGMLFYSARGGEDGEKGGEEGKVEGGKGSR